MKRYWIKLWIEILEDPKMGRLPEWLWKRSIELMLLAGENGDDGTLQPVEDIAWRLRTSEEKLTEALEALSEVGVVQKTPSGWTVSNFKKRQYSLSFDRTRRYRDRHSDALCDAPNASQVDKNVDDDSVSVSVSVSVSDSINSIFNAHFGNFNGDREQQRWETLVESIGKDRAEEIATWAERREIHMTNRGGLLDSLETAAKKWSVTKPLPGDVGEHNQRVIDELSRESIK